MMPPSSTTAETPARPSVCDRIRMRRFREYTGPIIHATPGSG
jgi:hypothetical protein